jgi:glycosyltransferase involved in cell wall biosynthesis
MKINILLPVLNEKQRLESGVTTTLSFLKEHINIPFQLTIIDNGSTDSTPEIGHSLANRYPEIEYLQLAERGVGLAFREGIMKNDADIVGYMDCDLSTDINHLIDVVRIFKEDSEVGLVNGSRFSQGSYVSGRKWYRNVTSYGLTFLLKLIFQMKANDSICGFKFFKKNVIEDLINRSSSEKGWFYIIELLLRAEKDKIKIVELPVVWRDDPNTKVKLVKVVSNYLSQIYRLFIEFKFNRKCRDHV